MDSVSCFFKCEEMREKFGQMCKVKNFEDRGWRVRVIVRINCEESFLKCEEFWWMYPLNKKISVAGTQL